MWLSIMGMYEYDDSLFDGLDVPTYTDKNNVVHVVDKTKVIQSILLNCAELEVIYPNFDTMKLAIGVWSAAEQDTWRKMYATQLVEYNPIWNVDAIETENETNERDIGRIHTGLNNETRNLIDAETRNLTDVETRNLTDTESVQGFNSNSWSDSKKVVGTGTDTFNHTGTDTFNHIGTDNITISNNETVNDDNTRINTKTRTGNIGITATQDLIRKERDIADFSIIKFITESFKKRFCIMVY